jgi:large subunit ribosomal protein L1
MKHGKSYRTGRAQIDRSKTYSIDEAMALLDAMPKAKFDETVDVAVRLNVNPRHADQMVRGTVVLPNGTGKTVRVLVITRGPKEKEAADAGADMVGADEYLPKIKEGWTDVDVIIATPDMMGELGKLGRILGPRGLMPNPKVGTVTADVAQAVRNAKAGQVQFRVDKAGIVHATIGRRSFDSDKLQGNLQALIDALNKAKPASSKGIYLKKVALSSTMGVGARVDVATIAAAPAQA